MCPHPLPATHIVGTRPNALRKGGEVRSVCSIDTHSNGTWIGLIASYRQATLDWLNYAVRRHGRACRAAERRNDDARRPALWTQEDDDDRTRWRSARPPSAAVRDPRSARSARDSPARTLPTRIRDGHLR